MEFLKGARKVRDYILVGDVMNKYFSCGWEAKDGKPAVYRVENIRHGNGFKAILEVQRVGGDRERESLNLAMHLDDAEVSLTTPDDID